MRPVQHIYLTAHGSFSTGNWLGEAAQFGIRLAVVPTASAPDKGALFTLPINGDATSEQGSQTGTNGTLTKTWTARSGPSGSVDNLDSDWQIDAAEDMRTFLDACKAYTYSAFKWTHVKIAPIGTDGKVCTDEDSKTLSASVYTFTTPLAGTNASMLPPQCALAISLRAPVLGRRGRGRMYMPAIGASAVGSDGTISATPGNTYRAAAVSLVNNLQNLPGTPFNIPIVTITSPGSASGYRPLEVRTGNRIDTIRSRREQVPEVYTTTAL